MNSDGPLHRTLGSLGRLAACWAILCVSSLAYPQDRARQPLEFEVDQAAWAMRAGAPVPLRLKITCSAPGIIEGDLRIQIEDGIGSTIALLQIPDQTYSAGRLEVEYLLPIQSHSVQSYLVVKCFFHDKNGPVYSSAGQLILPTRRSFVVPIVHGSRAGEGDDFAWLMLESWCPKHSTNPTATPMLTITPRIRGADLPQDAIKHLPHDIVVIEAGGFTDLGGPQVRALDTWVKGGGSLFLQIGPDELSTEQQAFLDRLTAKNPEVLDDVIEGTKLIPVIRVGTAAPLEYGFGQVWLTTQRSWAEATQADRMAGFIHLWRLKQVHRDQLSQTGQLSLEPARTQQNSQWNRTYGGQFSPGVMDDTFLAAWEYQLNNSFSARPGEMIEALMPRDVQAIPVWLLGGIIIVYIAAIGFGDYIVLGKLKRRRWTWFTFPAMTLAVSLLFIGTAKGYLGASQELSVVEYRDVAEDGTICRVQRFELLFRSSSGRSVTQLNNAAFTPVARQSPGNGYNQNRGQSLESQLVMIEGNPTDKASVTQQVEQWKPQLNRTVAFPRDQRVPWKLPTPSPGLSPSSPEFAAELSQKIKDVLPNTVGHMYFNERGMISGIDAVNNTINHPENARLLQLMMNCQPPGNQQNQGQPGAFTLFDQISPSADTGLTDVVIATPGHEVLCVAVREANNELVIYRWRFPVP